MLFRFSATCFLAAFAAGCAASSIDLPSAQLSSEADSPVAPAQRAPGASQTLPTAPASSDASACTLEAIWRARSDLTFDGDEAPEFAYSINRLIQASDEAPIVITSHLEANCVWKAVFSADEEVSNLAQVDHTATSTQILRRPQGLWTTAPQTSGWMHVVDATGKRIWIPLTNLTASAKYASDDCASLTARASATIAESASNISLTTSGGLTTVGALLGEKTSVSPRGWKVRLSFSADMTP
jgi:hypothetical protein